jgi:hypothetical protein
MKTIITIALLWLAHVDIALAQQINCGDAPKLRSSVEEKLKGDAEGKAQLLTKLLGNAALQGAIETSKTELYQQHQDVGKDEINLYFAWVSCQTISSDKNLASSEKLEKWMTIYKELLGQGSSGQSPKKPSDSARASLDASVFFVNGLKISVKKLVPPSNTNITTLILSILNIDDKATGIVLLRPGPTLTDEDGNSGVFFGSDGIQVCAFSNSSACIKQFDGFFQVQPNFPVNVVIKFAGLVGAGKVRSASFASRMLIVTADKDVDPAVVSLAFPDIPFAR